MPPGHVQCMSRAYPILSPTPPAMKATDLVEIERKAVRKIAVEVIHSSEWVR